MKTTVAVQSKQRIQIEIVRPVHKKLCSGCNQLPYFRRLVVVQGSGRNSTTVILCIGCGAGYLNEQKAVFERAVAVLRTGVGTVKI